VPDFQRARSDEQRAERRAAILATAAAMLAEMPVADLSLNELSRRVGLAKSNVLRYFDSREAVLLELLEDTVERWLVALEPQLPDPADDPDPLVRADRLASAIASSLAGEAMLCDLVGAQAAVLERNVSPAVAARFKRSLLVSVDRFAEQVRGALPELDQHAAHRFAGASMMTVGAAWSHCQPSPAMLAAYAADPELAALRLDFEATVTELLAVLLSGLLVRGDRQPPG